VNTFLNMFHAHTPVVYLLIISVWSLWHLCIVSMSVDPDNT